MSNKSQPAKEQKQTNKLSMPRLQNPANRIIKRVEGRSIADVQKEFKDAKSAGTLSTKTAKPKKKYNTFADVLNELATKKQQSKGTQVSKVSKVSKVSQTRDLLYGTGMTKKLAEKAGTDQKNIQSKSYSSKDLFNKALLLDADSPASPASPASADSSDSSPTSNEFGKFLDLNIKSNLMDSDIKLDPEQQAAVDGAVNQKYCVIIGRAGTGKTTVSKALINAVLPTISTIDLNSARMENAATLEPDLNVSICIVSFMGKAVQQIKRALPIELHALCNTIHSTLAFCPEKQEYIDESTGLVCTKRVFAPQFTEHNKLPFELCIIDEAGSDPVYLFNLLVKALPDSCRFILMGDLNQLPPVSGHSILGFAILKWPTYELKTLHRNSGIIAENASRIIDGKKPLKHPTKFIMQEIPDSGFEAFQSSVSTLQTLQKNNLFNPLTDAFIVPQNVDVLGQVAFNERLVRFFNPTKKINNIAINPPIIITAGYVHATYAVGDKIMLLSNDNKRGLTNGMIGIIEEILPNSKYNGESVANSVISEIEEDNFELDLSNLAAEIAVQKDVTEEAEEAERQASHIVVVKFQNVDEPVDFSTAGGFSLLTHAYAMTCHKAQGSEYETVVVLCHSANIRMLYREWLYTAITRAKTRVILLYNRRGIELALNRQQIKGKTIEEKAKKFIELSGKMDENDKIEKPLLAEPETLN